MISCAEPSVGLNPATSAGGIVVYIIAWFVSVWRKAAKADDLAQTSFVAD